MLKGLGVVTYKYYFFWSAQATFAESSCWHRQWHIYVTAGIKNRFTMWQSLWHKPLSQILKAKIQISMKNGHFIKDVFPSTSETKNTKNT